MIVKYSLFLFDLSKLGVFKDKKITFFRMILAYIGSKSGKAVILYRLSHYLGRKFNILGFWVTNHSVRIIGCKIRHGASSKSVLNC